jgi:hypothetical protein
MYVDGVETQYALQTSGSGTYATDAAQNLFIGNSSGGTATFDGQIDDVRVYNYPLTKAQVLNLFNGGSAVQFR